MTTVDDAPSDAVVDEPEAEAGAAATDTRRRRSRVRRMVMRPRAALVKVHRWLSFALLAWLVVISLTGAWLVVHHAVLSWLHDDRYTTTPGPDVGPEAAIAAAEQVVPDGATVYGTAMPSNGRGVYQVGAEIPLEDDEFDYELVYVDPGSGTVNAQRDEAAGFSQWLYRGHISLWQDNGIFGVFDPQDGWCRVDDAGHEPGGVRGVVCDVIPTGDDMVAWFTVGWIVVLITGVYVWYWPGIRKWANAVRIPRGRGRFAFHLSVHNTLGLIVLIPLMVIAFTGAAFAFPAMKNVYERVTPAQRHFELWTPPEDAASGAPDGREPLGLDRAAEIFEARYPKRTLDYLLLPTDETGMYAAWMTRGFSPWTREGFAGNTYVAIDQYSGETIYDGTPEEGNVFDQAWDDWSFPLHAGDFGGTPTRLIWVVVGLSPLALGVTGVVMNTVRRHKRARRPVDAAS